MAVALIAAGYYGREWQDVIDRSVANPIGPYQVTAHYAWVMKTHLRTGRIWAATEESKWQWYELFRAKQGSLAEAKN